MKITVNEEMNIVRILLRDTPIEESDEQENGVIYDYDSDGKVIGFEFLNAKEFFGDLESLKLIAEKNTQNPPVNEHSERPIRHRAKRNKSVSTRPLVAACA